MLSHKENRQAPTRRGLLKADFLRPAPQIASLMVQARPDHFSTLTPVLNAIDGVEVHASAENGRMVVTVEADTDQQLMEKIDRLQSQEHVITVSLVYHQIEA